MTEWFTKPETYEREIVHPNDKTLKMKVTFRPLSAGDRAASNEIRLSSDEDSDEAGASLRPFRMQLAHLHRAIVSWTLDTPPTPDALAQLEPEVFDELYKHMSWGNPTDDTVDGTGRVVPLKQGEPAASAAASS